MQRNGWKDITNWRTKQLNSYTKSQHYPLTTVNSRKKKWDLLENCQKFAHRLFLNACTWRELEDLIFYETCSCCRKMDQSLWQTLGTFDLIHSSLMWVQTMWSYGTYSTTVQIRTVSGLWFCRRPRRLKIIIRVNLMHFRKSHVRDNKLDVQETDFSFTQFDRSWNNFSRCRITYGWNSISRSLTISTTPKVKYSEICRVTSHQTSTPKTDSRFQPARQLWSEQCWLCAVER